jgi:ATP-dependent RNA helicase DeaD
MDLDAALVQETGRGGDEEGKRKGKGKAKGEKRREAKGRGRRGEIVRIFLPVGRKSGVRPADIVGAIANESNIDARLIGTIEISDNYSLVEVPDDEAAQIISAMRSTKIRGVAVKARREKF